MPLQFVAQGPMLLPTAPTYTGPGDVVSGAGFFFGGQAYTGAYAALLGSAFDVNDSGGFGSNSATIHFTAAGTLNPAEIPGYSPIKIAKAYDQTGAGNHFLQTGTTAQPTLDLSHWALPTMFFTDIGVEAFKLTIASFTRAQSFTLVAAIERAAAGSSNVFLGSPNVLVSLDHSGAQWGLDCGNGTVFIAATSSAKHAFIAVAQGATSILRVDASESGSVNPGTGAYSANAVTIGGANAGAAAGASNYCGMIGIWPGAFSGTDRTNMQQNGIKPFWGTL